MHFFHAPPDIGLSPAGCLFVKYPRMIKEGLMTDHGQKLIDIAKQKGKWESAGAQ